MTAIMIREYLKCTRITLKSNKLTLIEHLILSNNPMDASQELRITLHSCQTAKIESFKIYSFLLHNLLFKSKIHHNLESPRMLMIQYTER